MPWFLQATPALDFVARKRGWRYNSAANCTHETQCFSLYFLFSVHFCLTSLLNPIDDFLMIMLCTHCVHPLCNLPSFSSVESCSFEDMSLRLGRPLLGLASTGVVFSNALLSCLVLPLIHQDHMSCFFYVIVCPLLAISLFTPISFFLYIFFLCTQHVLFLNPASQHAFDEIV